MQAIRTRRFDRQRPTPSPSDRNLAIYEQVMLLDQVQTEVAQRFGVSQRRVSQICQQVDRWRQRSAAVPDSEQSEAQWREAERVLARKRYEHIYATVVQAMIHEREPLVTTKTITRNGQTTRDITTRAIAINPRWCGIALSVSKKLHRMDEEEGRSRGDGSQSVVDELDAALARVMEEIRQDAAQLGPASPADNPVDQAPPGASTLAPAARSSSTSRQVPA